MPGLKRGAGLPTLPCRNPACARPMIAKTLWEARTELRGQYAALGARGLCRPCYGKMRQGTLVLGTDQLPALALPCGTSAAYRRHRGRGEPACDPCTVAYRGEQNQRTARYRAARKVEEVKAGKPSRRGGLARCEVLPAVTAGSTVEQAATAARCVDRLVTDLADRAVMYQMLGLS